MSATTNIEWTDHTFNPWIGCTKVSPGCAHCYAETLDRNRYSKTLGGATKAAPISHWGPGAPRTRTQTWREPVKWNRNLVGTHPHDGRKVFCASLADWLDAEVPVQWRHDLLDLIDSTENLVWQLLTKRPELWRDAMQACALNGSSLAQRWLDGEAPPNVWLGTTTENQTRADERIPMLLTIPAHVRFLSCEPLLGPINLSPIDNGARLPVSWLEHGCTDDRIDWVICGGESGPGSRPMHPEWARGLREQCDAAGVPFFFKQWGEWLPVHLDPATKARVGALAREVHEFADGVKAYRLGKICAGALIDGVEHRAFPVEVAS